MKKSEFIKKVALTLEMSIKMAEDWLSRIHVEDKAELERLENYKQHLHELLLEVSQYTAEAYNRSEE